MPEEKKQHTPRRRRPATNAAAAERPRLPVSALWNEQTRRWVRTDCATFRRLVREGHAVDWEHAVVKKKQVVSSAAAAGGEEPAAAAAACCCCAGAITA